MLCRVVFIVFLRPVPAISASTPYTTEPLCQLYPAWAPASQLLALEEFDPKAGARTWAKANSGSTSSAESATTIFAFIQTSPVARNAAVPPNA